jgi:hypothetical protein
VPAGIVPVQAVVVVCPTAGTATVCDGGSDALVAAATPNTPPTTTMTPATRAARLRRIFASRLE